MANKHMKHHSLFSAQSHKSNANQNRKQILYTLEQLKLERLTIATIAEDVEQLDCSTTASENAERYSHFTKQFISLQAQTYMYNTIQPCHSYTFLSTRNESIHPNKDWHVNVHGSFILNFHQWKHTIVHPYQRILGFLGSTSGKEPTCQCSRSKR